MNELLQQQTELNKNQELAQKIHRMANKIQGLNFQLNAAQGEWDTAKHRLDLADVYAKHIKDALLEMDLKDDPQLQS